MENYQNQDKLIYGFIDNPDLISNPNAAKYIGYFRYFTTEAEGSFIKNFMDNIKNEIDSVSITNNLNNDGDNITIRRQIRQDIINKFETEYTGMFNGGITYPAYDLIEGRLQSTETDIVPFFVIMNNIYNQVYGLRRSDFSPGGEPPWNGSYNQKLLSIMRVYLLSHIFITLIINKLNVVFTVISKRWEKYYYYDENENAINFN